MRIAGCGVWSVEHGVWSSEYGVRKIIGKINSNNTGVAIFVFSKPCYLNI